MTCIQADLANPLTHVVHFTQQIMAPFDLVALWFLNHHTFWTDPSFPSVLGATTKILDAHVLLWTVLAIIALGSAGYEEYYMSTQAKDLPKKRVATRWNILVHLLCISWLSFTVTVAVWYIFRIFCRQGEIETPFDMWPMTMLSNVMVVGVVFPLRIHLAYRLWKTPLAMESPQKD
jgi:hypothetical protein